MTPARHPTLCQLLDDMIAFMDEKRWGSYNVEIKNGRIVHFFRTESVPVAEKLKEQRKES